jgi:hypothetical protein
VTNISHFLVIPIQYTKRHNMVDHCDRHITSSEWYWYRILSIGITKKCDMSVTVTYHAMSHSILYQYHSEEWYFVHCELSDKSLWQTYHSAEWYWYSILRDIAWYLTMNEISLFWVILIQYTMRHSMISHCDRHITLILYQYNSEEWYFVHCEISCNVS